MAISARSDGSWAYASSGSVTPTLSTHAAGDMMLVRVAYKSSAIATCSASTATSGWAKVGEFYDGAGNNSGNGTGSVNVAVFWKIAASASETNPTIDFSQTVTQVGHVAVVYQKGASEQWATPVGDGGYDSTADTSKSMTIASHVSVTAGDLVDFFLGIRDDSTCTSPSISQTGVTYDTVVETPSTAGSDTSGADGSYDGAYRLATSGTSSAAAVVTGTLSSSETGSAWMTRLRVSAGTSASAGAAAGTGAANADTAKVEARGTGAGAGTGAALAATGRPGEYGYADAAAATGAALDATAETAAGAITFNAIAAAATGAAAVAHMNLSASAGYAQGRSA